MSQSVPAHILGPTYATAQADLQADRERKRRAGEFLQVARALIVSRNDAAAETFLKGRPVDPRVIGMLEERAAVPGGLTTDSTWAGSLIAYQTAAEGFAESLRNISIFDRCLADGSFLRLPPATQVVVVTAGASASTVNETAPKPASQLSFVNVQLVMSKVAAFVVISQELARAGGAGPLALLGRELRSAVAVQTDSYFLSQLLSGITAIPSSGGASAVAVRQDLRVLQDALSYGSGARLYYVAPPAIAKRLAVLGDSAGGKALPGTLPTGGEIDGIPLVVSDAATAATLTLFDASQVAVAAGDIVLDRSSAATLQLDTAPDSPPIVSSNYQSLWAQNMSALRAERYLSAQRMRTTAAASISGITGIGSSPS